MEEENDQSTLLSEQVNRLISWQETHTATDSFPELSPQFEENSRRIREKLEGLSALNSFSEIHALGQDKINQNQLTLSCYAFLHRAYSYILSASIQGSMEPYAQEFEKIKGFIKEPSLINTALVTDSRDSAYTLFHASQCGIYLLPFVSKKGLFPLRLLTRAYGYKIALIGLPLDLSSYDGNLDVLPEEFQGHDILHIVFQQWIAEECFDSLAITPSPSYPREFRLKIFPEIPTWLQATYEALQKMNLLIETHSKNIPLDDFCMFHIGHENGFQKEDDAVPEDSHFRFNLRGSFLLGKLTPGFFRSVCKRAKSEILRRVTSASEPIDLSKCPFARGESLVFEPLAFYIKEKKLFLDGPIPQEAYQEEGNKFTAIFNVGIDSFYNSLFDIQAMLKAGGIDFPIWDENAYNVEGMTQIIDKIFDDFQNHYEPLI